MTINHTFPDQTIAESAKKDKNWIRQHFDYADALYEAKKTQNVHYTASVDKFLGQNVKPDSLMNSKTIVDRTVHGKLTTKTYTDLRWYHSKIIIVNNEYQQRPLSNYVYTINKHEINKKREKRNTLLGMTMAKDMVEHIRTTLGVNIFDGMEIPESEDKARKLYSLPTENEKTFSIILKAMIDSMNLKIKFARNHFSALIGNRMFGRVELLPDGKREYSPLDVRSVIVESDENDPLHEKTRMMGSKRFMSISEINNRYKLTEEQRKNLEAYKTSSDLSNHTKHYTFDKDNQFIKEYEVTHIEWKTLQNRYYLVDIDDKIEGYQEKQEIPTKEYEENKALIDTQAKANGKKVISWFKENKMHGIRIGHDTIIESGYEPYKLPNNDFSYTYCEFNSFDGRIVSIVDLADEFNFLLNIIMMNIRHMIKKYIGTIIFFDEAMLPKGKDAVDVIYDAIEKGMVNYNSRATGNASRQNINETGIIIQSLSALADLQQLIMLKQDLKKDLDDITSVNKERQGASAATQTATAVRQNMTQSRVMTYHINMFTDLFVQKTLQKLVEYTRISYAFIYNEDDNEILGDLSLSEIRINKNVSYDRLGVRLANIERELEILEKLEQTYFPLALQRDSVRVEDILKADLSETVNEKIAILEQGFKIVNEINAKQAASDNEAEQALSEQQIAANKALQDQIHENTKELTILKGFVEGAQDTLAAMNSDVSERAKASIQENMQKSQQESQ